MKKPSDKNGMTARKASGEIGSAFTLIELLVKTACSSSDLAVDQGMRYERGEMR